MTRPAGPLRSLSLCSGIGGIDLALLKWARPVLYVEKDPWAHRQLRRLMRARALPTAELAADLTKIEGDAWSGRHDLLIAGFPCQPFSSASRGRKRASDLWPEVLRVILEARSPLVFLENVQRLPIENAAAGLSSHGFTGIFTKTSAAQVGAPHDRRRWWLLAHAHDEEQPTLSLDGHPLAGLPETPGSWDELPGELLGVDDGVPDRMDRLRALGNAVVPAQAAHAFSLLARELRLMR